ncbi:MAG: hypothetical protein ACJATI_005313 [Halioglobus sp.]|jgi:hypothetical protein
MGDGFDGAFPADTSKIFATLNQRLYRYDLNNQTRASLQPDDLFYKVVKAHPTNPNMVFCGSSNIYKSTNQGSNWSNEGASASWSLAFAPSN